MVPILRYSGCLELPGTEKCKVVSVEEARQHPTVRGLRGPKSSSSTCSHIPFCQTELSSPASPRAGLQPLECSLALKTAPGD